MTLANIHLENFTACIWFWSHMQPRIFLKKGSFLVKYYLYTNCLIFRAIFELALSGFQIAWMHLLDFYQIVPDKYCFKDVSMKQLLCPGLETVIFRFRLNWCLVLDILRYLSWFSRKSKMCTTQHHQRRKGGTILNVQGILVVLKSQFIQIN